MWPELQPTPNTPRFFIYILTHFLYLLQGNGTCFNTILQRINKMRQSTTSSKSRKIIAGRREFAFALLPTPKYLFNGSERMAITRQRLTVKL